MVRLENITFRYPGDLPPALLNVNLEFEPGERTCVMGANGSGKTTFAKLISGLLKTQQGRLSLFAGKSNSIPVGLLFQNPDNQLVAVTVEKEIAFALENLAFVQSEMEKRITSVLKSFSIEHLRYRLTSELSAGEKQRIALAALFVFAPPILVLDEPDSFLDEEGKRLFREELEKLKERTPDLTIIEITQYPEVARSYERLIVFSGGRVAADDKPSEILNNKSFCIKCGIDFDNSVGKEIHLEHIPRPPKDVKTPAIESIKLDRVNFKYPLAEKYVLQNFSAEFRRNEITGILGPSACGKSTLGMLLCGILEEVSGNIFWQDQSGRNLEKKQTIGRITACLQQPERQIFLHSCLQEVEFGPKNFGRTFSRKSIQELFESAGLPFDQFNARDPFTLSLGEKRRLAFASVLSIMPNFIIFDEPTCALDREGVGRFLALVKALRKSGMGIIIISHDKEVVQSLSDKVVVFDAVGNYWLMASRQYFKTENSPITVTAN